MEMTTSTMNKSFIVSLTVFVLFLNLNANAFVVYPASLKQTSWNGANLNPFLTSRQASKGFGGGHGGFGSSSKTKSKKKGKGKLISTLADKPKSSKSKQKGVTYVKSEQDALLQQLASTASLSPIGQAVAASPIHGTPDADPFWELIPSLISSKFPNASAKELKRVAGFVSHALDENLPLEASIVEDEWR